MTPEGHKKKSDKIVSAAIAFALGSLSVLAMAPYEWPIVLLFTLSSLYVLLSAGSEGKVAFLYGWSFGFGYFVFGLSWIGNALLVEGNEYAWAYPLALTVLPALLSFFPAFAVYIWRKFYNPFTLPGFLGFTASLSLFEWLRGNMMS